MHTCNSNDDYSKLNQFMQNIPTDNDQVFFVLDLHNFYTVNHGKFYSITYGISHSKSINQNYINQQINNKT